MISLRTLSMMFSGHCQAFLDGPKKEKGSKFGTCFIVGMPGSFYGRLFPDNSSFYSFLLRPSLAFSSS
ncbi:hypothetical protein SLE2022_201140 [Rubroshorea leprosula]